MVHYYSARPPMPDGRSGLDHARESPYYVDPPNLYGTFVGQGCKAGPAVFARGQRRRINIVAIAVSLLLPWLVFSAVFAVMSFSIHYDQPAAAYALVGVGLAVVVVCGGLAADTIRKQASGDPRGPTWYIFITITCFLAWLLALVLGDVNFYQNMQPYYDALNLNAYPSVDPSKMRGQQLMDAGRMAFVDGARLDQSKSMGFKNLELYCVAPVSVTANGTLMELASYDFWAVGTNCCSGSGADFHCGEFNNPRARAGLRLMRDDQRAYFRLAVQQAEAAYSIKAVHPLFIYWMEDPGAEINAYQEEGLKYYLLGMLGHFALQLFLVVCAVVAFARLGQI